MGAVSAPARRNVSRSDLAPVAALVVVVATTLATAVGLLLFVRDGHAVLTAPEAGVPPALVLLVGAAVVLGSLAAHGHRWQLPWAGTGLAVATVAALLPLWASWSDLEPGVRAALLPLTVLVPPALAATVARGGSALLRAAWGLALLALAVHLLTYDPLQDLTCLRVCDQVAAPLEPLFGGGTTWHGLSVFLALSALAGLTSLGAALMTAHHRRWAAPVAAACLVSVAVDVHHLLALVSTSGVPPHLHARTWPPLAVAVVGLVLAGDLARTVRRRRRVDRLLRQLEEQRHGTAGPDGAVAVAFAVPEEPGRFVDLAGDDVRPAGQATRARRGPPVMKVDHSLVHDLTPARRLALQNARLAALAQARLRDVRAAQRRAVRRSDEEQHRIERDLHDGLQQTLLGATFLVATAEQRCEPQTAEELARARQRLTGALDRLRELSHGVVPMALEEEGLAAALEELALESPVPLTVQVAEPGPVTGEALRALYLVVAGVLRPHVARAAHVRLTREQRELVLGLRLEHGAPQTLGVDLVDRLEALGGQHRWTGAGTATVLEVRIPCGS